MQIKRFLLCAASFGLIATPNMAIASSPPIVLAQFQGEEQTSINVYQAASPAVVTIRAGRGSGSGSIISAEGLILTNEHVIRDSGNGQVTVRTPNGRSYTGAVIATDRRNDLALVRLLNTQGERFPTIPLANADGIRVGQQVFAIGSPFGLSGTLTRGILSRIGRDGDLQTDASLNPGNSGGPLLNSRGELIGVNKAILSPDGRSNSGIGFATSATIARDFITQNANRPVPSGGVARQPTPSSPAQRSSTPNSPRLGVTVDGRNLTVLEVEPGSVAATIGLRRGDRIVAINQRRLTGVGDLQTFLDSRPNSVLLTVSRNNRLANVRVRF
ncbi:MAG: trypsin-like peptidase domain-containing protein [Desertifilum sp.]|nr:trypsin-like peptidase domain-containing protein [Desertifilum sp.]